MTPVRHETEAFLQNLRKSGLLGKDRLRAVEREFKTAGSAREIARTLVADGALTRFQARMLLAGRNGGFFLGRYRILSLIGRGGMGRVYEARQETLGRTVALKILASGLTSSPRARELFQHEVEASGRLRHPNIVTAYDAGEADDRVYLALEFVDGPNLRQLVRQVGPLPIGLACEIVRQVALGLQHAHEHGMVHRDIKPANVLVCPARGPSSVSVKILDFGLARLHEPEAVPAGGSGTIVTGHNVIMGTPDFVSPEQARDLHAADIRSDLYSLGCTFFYLLAGQAPFAGGTTLEKLMRHNGEEAPLVESLRPEVPMAVCDLVHRLLAKDPADRFQAPAELARAIAPFAEAGTLQVRRRKRSGRESSPATNSAPSTQADTAHGRARTHVNVARVEPAPKAPRRWSWLAGLRGMLTLAGL